MAASREASFGEDVESVGAQRSVKAICLRRPESTTPTDGAQLGFGALFACGGGNRDRWRGREGKLGGRGERRREGARETLSSSRLRELEGDIEREASDRAAWVATA